MAYIGQVPVSGDNSFRILDDITSYTLTFDGSSSSVVSTTNYTITQINHRFVTAQRVTYTHGGGTAIGGLTSGTAYFIIKVDQNTIKLATSAVNANNNAAIDLNALGTGTSHTLNVAFDSVNTKFKATYNNGTKAELTRAAQLQISINGVIQQPQDSIAPVNGFGLENDSTIVFSTAPSSTDVFWGNVIANSYPTFDVSDNTVDTFTGTGSQTNFSLSKTPANNQNVLVTINGVVQYPSDATTSRSYSVDANVLTFTSAPAGGSIIQVRHIGFAGATSSAVTGFYGRTGNVGLTTADNVVIGTATIGVGAAGTSLLVQGNARITGILSIGQGTITIDGDGGTISGVSNLSGPSITGVATFSTGPVLIGTGSSTGTASQTLQVTGGGYVSGNLGVGTTNPQVKLQVGGVIGFNDTNIKIGDATTGCSITSGIDNFFAGVGAGRSTTSGIRNNFFGNQAGQYNTTGCYNNFLGFAAGCANTTACYNNFLGRSAGRSNTTGTNNNFLGYLAGFNNTTGTHNNFLGLSAGCNNTTGTSNNFFGYQAGFANTTGTHNNFFGTYAGYCNTTGSNNNFFGNCAGFANTTGSCNIFIGVRAGCLNTSGGCNNFFGPSAGRLNITGNHNNFLGYYSGYSNTTGSHNFFGGYQTGYLNTSGSNNVFIGQNAGFANTTGNNNNFFGRCAGFCNTTGFYNNFIGDSAGERNTTGSYNNFFGLRVGFANTTGCHNNFLGRYAGCSNTTGCYNNFLGQDAGRFNTTGTSNNFLGVNAGYCNTTGTYNNFFGRNAGFGNTTGSNNIFIGQCAGYCNTTGCYNNFFGTNAGRCNTTGCNNNFLGQQAGQFNTTGNFNHFIGQSAGCLNTSGSINTFIGHAAGLGNTTGSCNSFFGWYSGGKNTSGSSNTFLGRYAGCSNTIGSHNVAIGNSAQLPSATGSCQLAIGSNGVNWIYGDSAGDVGIGTTNPQAPLHVVGSGTTALLVSGNARITGILTVGTSSLTFDGNANTITGLSTITGSSNFSKPSFAGISSTITATATDVFVYDTRKDSDGGAWRKRTQHTSWYNENLNTASRGSRRDFPAVAVLVLTSGSLTIYDGDDPDMPMWMVFNVGSLGVWLGRTLSTKTSVFMLNGEVCVGGSYNSGHYEALIQINFIKETALHTDSTGRVVFSGNIYNRNTVNSYYTDSSLATITNLTAVNDVAMTVLPNAPIDPATGLPVPTIAVATNGGVSIIKDDGTVVSYNSSNYGSYGVYAVGGNKNYWWFGGKWNSNTSILAYNKNTGTFTDYNISSITSAFGLAPDETYSFPANTDNNQLAIYSPTGGNGINWLRNDGFALIDYGNESTTNYLKCKIDRTFNTGWMHGDIKGAFLSDTSTASVTGTELVTNGDFATSTLTSYIQLYNCSLSVVSNQLRVTSTAASGYCEFYIGISDTTKYHYLSFQFVGASGITQFGIYASSTGYITDTNAGWSNSSYQASRSAGTYTLSIPPGNGMVGFVFNLGSLGQTWTFDNISLKPVQELDRSVNNRGLAVYGTISKTAVATGADLVAYSGWSDAVNYLRHRSSTNYGSSATVTFMAWQKTSDVGDYQYAASLYDPTSNKEIGISIGSNVSGYSGVPYIYDATNGVLQGGSISIADGTWHFVVGILNGTTRAIYVDGVLRNSAPCTAVNLAAVTYTNVGHYTNTGNVVYSHRGSLALVRISSSAPSPDQIKKIYNDEKALFQENSKATIYGSSNVVTGLAYDDTTKLLHVGTSSGRSDFQGLERINNTTTAVTTAISASNGLVAEQ